MKTMKKVLALTLACLMLASLGLGLASCGNKGDYTVGIIQLVQHEALDAATKGFKDALVAEFGDKVEFIEHNAQGDSNACNTAANDLVTKKVDLIMANATPALQSAASATTEIPILGTSVTDYVTALDIKGEFNGVVGGNISGTSDLAPLDKQAAMIKELYPNAATIGLLYCSAEANSKFQATEIRKELIALGWDDASIKDFTFSASSDVATVSATAAAACDVLYVPTDNTAADCTETILGAIGNTPVIAGEAGICSGCGVATLSIDYYELGKITGEMAVKILKGEKKVSEMAIEYAPATTKMYNADRCQALGLTLPTDYVAISKD